MAAKKDDKVPVKREMALEPSGDEVPALPIETLKSLAEIISRHPDEMLRVIRRYMEDDSD